MSMINHLAVDIVQVAGTGVYTATFKLPRRSQILDVGAQAMALWTDTSASMIVGDAADPDGFFTATDLKATDLLVGEQNNLVHPGGKDGAYIVAEQRVLYQVAKRSVIFQITQVGVGVAGRIHCFVTYASAAVGSVAYVKV